MFSSITDLSYDHPYSPIFELFFHTPEMYLFPVYMVHSVSHSNISLSNYWNRIWD